MRLWRECWVLAMVLAVCFGFSMVVGCAGLQRTEAKSGPAEAAEGVAGPEPTYYDFEDVLVPVELKVDKAKSFVYEGPGFKAGILALAGRVEINSLITFFENNMAKDNWRLVAEFKSPRTMMLFNKPNRSAIISITEKQFNTEAEIWVAPALEEAEETLLK